mgnify:CR=1 FL=1
MRNTPLRGFLKKGSKLKNLSGVKPRGSVDEVNLSKMSGLGPRTSFGGVKNPELKKAPTRSIFDSKTSIVKDNTKSREEYASKQKQPKGINKKIVDTITKTVIPGSATEALGMVGGAGIVRALRKGGSKLYNIAKLAKKVKSTTPDKT